MTHETCTIFGAQVDRSRLFADLNLTDGTFAKIAELDMPWEVRVPSLSPIKTGTVSDTLRIVYPTWQFNVIGVGATSGVPEEPVGMQTLVGVANRHRNGVAARDRIAPGEAERSAWWSVESGLFRVSHKGIPLEIVELRGDDSVQYINGADLTTEYDPDGEYFDRAVAAISLPDRPTVACVSPDSEAVKFPKDAVATAFQADGSFSRNTVGKFLFSEGLVRNKQDPHIDLTKDREGGPLGRPEQMARVFLRCLVELARE